MATEKGKTSLKKDAVLVYVGYVLRYLGQIVLIPYYGRVLGPESYGQVLAATSLMTIVMAILGFGFSLRGTRDTACAETRVERSRIFNAHMMGRLLLLPAGVAATGAGWYFSKALSGDIMFAVIAFLIACVNAFNFGWFFQGLRKFKTSIVIDTMLYPLNIGFALLLVRGPEDGLWALLSLLLAGALCLGMAFILCVRHVDIDLTGIKEGWQEIKGSTVLFLNAINFTVLNSGSTYILSTFAAAGEVGFYGSAERFFSVAIGLLAPLAQVLMPTISNTHGKDRDKAMALSRKGIAFETAYGVCGLAGGAALAPFLIPLIMGADFTPSVLIFQLLICALPFAALRHAISLYVYVPLNHEKYVWVVSLVNVALFLLLALAIAPLHGGTGMAAARILSEGVAIVVSLVIVKRLNLMSHVLPAFHRTPAKEA